MPRTKDELTQYIRDLAKEKGFTPEQTERAVVIATGDDEIAHTITPLLDLVVGRQADYSRHMNAARDLQIKAKADYDKLEDWRVNEAQPALTRAQSDAEALRTRVQKFEALYGPLDETVDLGGGKSVTSTGDVVRTADVEKLLQSAQQTVRDQMAKEFIAYDRERSALMTRHARAFKGELLDANELLDVIGRHASDPLSPQALSLTQAYDEIYGEKVRELETRAREAELEAAERRGIEKGRTAAAGSMMRTGASVAEGTGEFWDHMGNLERAGSQASSGSGEPQKSAAASTQSGSGRDRALSEADRANAFAQDLREALAKNDVAAADT